jgi:hypothetical protein
MMKKREREGQNMKMIKMLITVTTTVQSSSRQDGERQVFAYCSCNVVCRRRKEAGRAAVRLHVTVFLRFHLFACFCLFHRFVLLVSCLS